MSKDNEVVLWFSCGASSAVAGKLAVDKYGNDVDLVYCDTGGEHESNHKFLKDCEEWYDREIIILKNPKYKDHFDVVEKERFINSPYGARCTFELKRKMREKSNYCESINIFGYTIEEVERAKKALYSRILNLLLSGDDDKKDRGIKMALNLKEKSPARYGHLKRLYKARME